ncbi:MAG: helix-turn-helix domain-containing protein [Eubacteriales bacterium]|nr:helix-turn-helix domain-containing protein [Eubacteriales bacterium]
MEKRGGQTMAADTEREAAVNQQVYMAADIQRMLGIGKSSAYTFLEEVHRQKNPPFRVLKIGKLFRVPKRGFDEWLNGGGD